MPTIFINQISFLKSLKKGEPKAYTFLIDSYHHKLCLYAFSLTNDHDLSEDIVQNVFIMRMYLDKWKAESEKS